MQDVGRAIVSDCMGCPLLILLAVSAIRQEANVPRGANLMACSPDIHDKWQNVKNSLMSAASKSSARGARPGDYTLTVREVYAASVRRATDSCARRDRPTVPGATATAVTLLLRVLRLFPAGRWIPEAAVVAIWRSLSKADGVDGSDSSSVCASITLLADYSIIDCEARSVFQANGVFQLLLTSHITAWQASTCAC
jgi:hypothetical protein